MIFQEIENLKVENEGWKTELARMNRESLGMVEQMKIVRNW